MNANETPPTIDLPADAPAWVRREAEAAWRRWHAGEDVPPLLLGWRTASGRTKRLILHVDDAAAERHAARRSARALGGGDAA